MTSTEKEENNAFEYLCRVRDASKERAKSGSIESQYRLVHMCSHTSQLLPEPSEAKYWAKKAADGGYSETHWHPGNLYALGDRDAFISKDKKLAFKYYKLASENGFYRAFYNYAFDLITGEGGKKIYVKG